MSSEELIVVLLIFVLRVVNYSVGTIRLLVVARGQRIIGSAMAGLEALIFAIVVAKVITDLDNTANLVAYCAGAAVGSYMGMALEAHFIRGFMVINVITHEFGRETALALREAGFGVTTTVGEGKDGEVTTLRSVVNKHEMPQYLKMLQGINPNAFVSLEEVRSVRRGWTNHGFTEPRIIY